MDRKNKQIDFSSLAPAHLFIGPSDDVIEHTHKTLQTLLCPHNGCLTCTTCIAIRTHQHHALMWFSSPKKPYTRDAFQDMFATITFQLEEDQHFFFVIQDAHMLMAATANSMLKSIEEPPPGYHFIFLTNYPLQLIGTITSRCVTQTIAKTGPETIEHNALYQIFTNLTAPNPLSFLAALEKSAITEHESMELLDAILLFWLTQYKKEQVDQAQTNDKTETVIEHLKRAMEQPPMPGSSKIFWKNLFLQVFSA